jgi:hypothetical protein
MARAGSAAGGTEPSAASAPAAPLDALTRIRRRVLSLCRRRPILAVVAVGISAVLVGVVIVRGEFRPEATGVSGAIPPAAAASLDELASATGCPGFAVEIEGKDYRRARCGTSPEDRYWLMMFQTEANAREWLQGSRSYGGVYLVGERWIITGPRPVLESFQQKLGGTVETGGH